jgi:hypothetical protein
MSDAESKPTPTAKTESKPSDKAASKPIDKVESKPAGKPESRQAGKGSKRRPYKAKQFAVNYEAIRWGKRQPKRRRIHESKPRSTRPQAKKRNSGKEGRDGK